MGIERLGFTLAFLILWNLFEVFHFVKNRPVCNVSTMLNFWPSFFSLWVHLFVVVELGPMWKICFILALGMNSELVTSQGKPEEIAS